MEQTDKKSALDRHRDASAAYKIAVEHHQPSTSQCHQEIFIWIFTKEIFYPEVLCFFDTSDSTDKT